MAKRQQEQRPVVEFEEPVSYQDQGMPPNTGMFNPYQEMQNKSNEFSRYRIDFEDDIIKFDLILAQEFENEDGVRVSIPGSKPLCNPLGRARLVSMLRAMLNKNNVMSNLSETDVRVHGRGFRNNIVNILFNNYREFGINRSDFDFIVDSMNTIGFCLLKRPWRAGERESIDQHTQRTELIQHTDNNNSKGLSRIFR